MILHIGNDVFVKSKDIIAILDYNEAVKNKDTRLFLKGLPLEKINEEGLKSVVFVDEDETQKLYVSPISSKTLHKRYHMAAFLDTV